MILFHFMYNIELHEVDTSLTKKTMSSFSLLGELEIHG